MMTNVRVPRHRPLAVILIFIGGQDGGRTARAHPETLLSLGVIAVVLAVGPCYVSLLRPPQGDSLIGL